MLTLILILAILILTDPDADSSCAIIDFFWFISKARELFMRSNLDVNQLKKVWDLSDMDKVSVRMAGWVQSQCYNYQSQCYTTIKGLTILLVSITLVPNV